MPKRNKIDKRSKKRRRRPRRNYRQPNWEDITLVSRRNLGGGELFEYNGYFYCTPGEVAMARLLTKQGIEFTPDVTFPIPPKGGGKKSRSYVPDFIFNKKEFIWTDEDGTEHIIHGIECKGANVKSEKAKALYGKRGINVIVVLEAEIDLYDRRGRLPLEPRPVKTR